MTEPRELPKRHVEIVAAPHFQPTLGVWGLWLSLEITDPSTGRLKTARASFVGLPPELGGAEVSIWDFIWGEIAQNLDPNTPAWWTPFLKACGFEPLEDSAT